MMEIVLDVMLRMVWSLNMMQHSLMLSVVEKFVEITYCIYRPENFRNLRLRRQDLFQEVFNLNQTMDVMMVTTMMEMDVHQPVL
jgi:hypothetical protein